MSVWVRLFGDDLTNIFNGFVQHQGRSAVCGFKMVYSKSLGRRVPEIMAKWSEMSEMSEFTTCSGDRTIIIPLGPCRTFHASSRE